MQPSECRVRGGVVGGAGGEKKDRMGGALREGVGQVCGEFRRRVSRQAKDTFRKTS